MTKEEYKNLLMKYEMQRISLSEISEFVENKLVALDYEERQLRERYIESLENVK